MQDNPVDIKKRAGIGPTTSADKLSSTVNTGPKTTIRSPFVGFNEVINSLSVHEKGLRTGFYNSIALIFLLFVLIVIYFCYWILKPFLQPLVWAILCGSALHPFKQRLFHCSTKWIKEMKSDGKPITVATICLPFVVINKAIDIVLVFCSKYWKVFAFLFTYYLLSSYFWQICYYFIDNSVINSIVIFVKLLSHLTNPENSLIVISLIIAYLIGVSFCWSDSSDKFFTFLAPFVWIIFLIHIISWSGTVGYLLSLIIISIIIIGLIKTITTGHTTSSASDQIDGIISLSLKLKNTFIWISMYVISMLFKDKEDSQSSQKSGNDSEPQSDCDDTDTHQIESIIKSPVFERKARSDPNSRRTSLISSNGENKNNSNLYLCLVLWALVFVQMQTWSIYKLILVISIPTIFKLLKTTSSYASKLILNNIHRFNGFIAKRNNAIFHPLLKNLFNYFIAGDKLIMNTIESSLNGITSLTIICFTIVSLLFFGIFMSIQIYGESLNLVNSISNVFNKTISYYPESSQLLPQSLKGVDGMLDQMVRNGYEYGREYIKSSVQNTFNVDGNDTKSIAVEKQILEIWDRAYHLWLIRNTNDSDSVPKKGPYEIDKLSTAFLSLDLYLVFNILKENIDILISVLDSVWLVLKGNASLLFTAIAAVFSILLGGGLGLMNLGLSFIIFTTALFYLLSASGKYYKPIELVNRIFPSEVAENNSCFTDNKFGRAVEEAINGVFAASLKMSTFYGLYTFLIHTLFDVDIVYIPSVMAAVFGAVPFLSAFWASFPAFLELFFGQNQRIKAILLLITAYFPSLFVDSTIYSEIKSAGHPYLTGLAIAGGVFYLGFEGALFGPILLCFLFVAFNIYTSIMEERPIEGNRRVWTPITSLKNSQLLRMQSSDH